jgi:hypothetical protein
MNWLEDWMKEAKWLERYPLPEEPDFWLEIDGKRVTCDEAVAMCKAHDKLMDEVEAGFGAGPALYRASGGRMGTAQDIRNLKHLKLIARGGYGDGTNRG